MEWTAIDASPSNERQRQVEFMSDLVEDAVDDTLAGDGIRATGHHAQHHRDLDVLWSQDMLLWQTNGWEQRQPDDDGRRVDHGERLVVYVQQMQSQVTNAKGPSPTISDPRHPTAGA